MQHLKKGLLTAIVVLICLAMLITDSLTPAEMNTKVITDSLTPAEMNTKVITDSLTPAEMNTKVITKVSNGKLFY